MKTIGRHLIAEFYACDAAILDDLEVVERLMAAAAAAVGVTVVGQAFHKYAPQGVTGTLLIAESHMSVHTWPEARYAAVDIYTCGGLDPRAGFRYLRVGLDASSCRMQEIVRGLPDDLPGVPLPDDVTIISDIAPLT